MHLLLHNEPVMYYGNSILFTWTSNAVLLYLRECIGVEKTTPKSVKAITAEIFIVILDIYGTLDNIMISCILFELLHAPVSYYILFM